MPKPSSPCRQSLQTLPTELQLMIIACLDNIDKAALLESSILHPNLLLTPHTLHEYDDIGYTILLSATYAEYQKAVRLILTTGANPSLPSTSPTDNAATALLLSAERGNLPIINLLLSHGAGVNETNNINSTALHFAANSNNLELVDILLEHDADPNINAHEWGTPLKIAADKGHVEALKSLIKARANVNALLPFVWRRGHTEDEGMLTPLYYAAVNGHVECVRLLLEAGAIATYDPAPAIPPNEPGWFVRPPTLRNVAAAGKPCVVDDWLRVYREYKTKAKMIYGFYENLPFTLTPGEKQRYAEVMRLLIAAGAEVGLEGQFSRVTALHAATVMGNEAAVEVLLQEGANVNARMQGDVSAVGLARALGHEKIVKLLEVARENRQDWTRPVVKPKPSGY